MSSNSVDLLNTAILQSTSDQSSTSPKTTTNADHCVVFNRRNDEDDGQQPRYCTSLLQSQAPEPSKPMDSICCCHSHSKLHHSKDHLSSSCDDDDYETNDDSCHRNELTDYITSSASFVPPESLSSSTMKRNSSCICRFISRTSSSETQPVKPCILMPWKSDLRPLTSNLIAGSTRRPKDPVKWYDIWSLDEILHNRLMLGLMALAVALLGSGTGLVLGWTFLEQSYRRAIHNTVCPVDHVRCVLFGCVHFRYICTELLWQCPEAVSHFDCNRFNKSDSDLMNYFWEELEQETNRKHYVTVTSHEERPIRDASGWVNFSKGSSAGSKYIVLHKSMTFYGAQDQCRKFGGYLVHVNSIREQAFLEEFLSQELRIEAFPSVGIGFWIGARRPRGGHGGTCMYDQWKWVDAYGRSHGTISGFTAFIPGKPDNYYGPEECLYMSHESADENRFLKWDDAPCDLNSIGSIRSVCEVELA